MEIESAHIQIPELDEWKQGELTFAQDATIDLPQIVTIDGTSLHVLSGTTLRLPNIDSYFHAALGNSQHRVLEASGLGSRLELPSVAYLQGGDIYNSRIWVGASDGGFVDLSQVRQIADPSFGDVRYRAGYCCDRRKQSNQAG